MAETEPKAAEAQADANSAQAGEPKKRTRATRPFPAVPFEEALGFANELYRVGSGRRVRRLTLFDDLKKAPDSGASRMLITNSSRYGLISGNYSSEYLELTDDGVACIADGGSRRDQVRVRVKLAIEGIDPFGKLYERFVNTRLPARAVLADALKEFSVPAEFIEEGLDTFIVNMRFTGLLQTLSGADRIVTINHLLDSLPSSASPTSRSLSNVGDFQPEPARRELITQDQAGFDTACFYITPIGEDSSEEREHSDLFLGNIVEPAFLAFDLKVIRADKIDKPGMITRQIIEYILKSRLVIVDLSFHNPNVFYELALRHATRLPIVQIARAKDRIPFDVHQMRTIVIDTTSIYTLLPKVETYRSEIASQVRRALESEREMDTPVSTYFPEFRISAA